MAVHQGIWRQLLQLPRSAAALHDVGGALLSAQCKHVSLCIHNVISIFFCKSFGSLLGRSAIIAPTSQLCTLHRSRFYRLMAQGGWGSISPRPQQVQGKLLLESIVHRSMKVRCFQSQRQTQTDNDVRSRRGEPPTIALPGPRVGTLMWSNSAAPMC